MNRTLCALACSCLLGACAGVSNEPDAAGLPLDAGDDGGQVDGGAGDAGDDAGLDAGMDAGAEDGGMDAGIDLDGGADGGADAGCFIGSVGVYGECMDTSVCTAMSGYSPTPGYCPGPVNIQCCSPTPSVSNNPPVPVGWKLMMQSEVTPAMTTWAVAILHDPVTYPMFSTTTMVFGALTVMARVEWHPPDFQNSAIHRGVTLYEPG